MRCRSSAPTGSAESGRRHPGDDTGRARGLAGREHALTGSRLLDDERAGAGRGRARPRQVERLHDLRRPLRPALRRRRAHHKPRLLGSLQLPEGASYELLLHGNRLLVLSRGGLYPVDVIGGIRSPIRAGLPQSTLIEVDVGDPGAMRIVRSLAFDAEILSARLVGPVARVVTTSSMPRRCRSSLRRRRHQTRRPPLSPTTATSCAPRRSARGCPATGSRAAEARRLPDGRSSTAATSAVPRSTPGSGS